MIGPLLGKQKPKQSKTKMYFGTQMLYTNIACDFRELRVSFKPFRAIAFVVKQYSTFGSEEWPYPNLRRLGLWRACDADWWGNMCVCAHLRD